ncbi:MULTISPECIES: thiamine diphosphokinase [Oceanobacillus]|uniref:thiamine diphosphokinase n=1 Tax=Oceanobacillus TaxID=182709 RepID=UPI0003460DA7|nr:MULTISPECIES: thiamine diphosphokinase [Oceanobacillus]MBT2598755.1 thiamine diphosphokinase [Oceanobacillus sp. ISL-74]MBT2651674.1 thiamine diphosphokinase [Oceanobacillus sp. ISL-73]OEH54617.1 thiamine pyrophosphokinase [Oceanobacillus sp. E9]
MKTIGIIGNGPKNMLPDLTQYNHEIDSWIGADRGALYLAQSNIHMDIALGDFDSVSNEERQTINKHAKDVLTYSPEKNYTDLEIAIQIASEQQVDRILLFGVTGGRLDHELMNIQLLYQLLQNDVEGRIVDKTNQIQMIESGEYTIESHGYTYISFIAFTNKVEGLTLEGFEYPLTEQTIEWGSSLCISNKLSQKKGTFSFRAGILLLIKSCDTIQ